MCEKWVAVFKVKVTELSLGSFNEIMTVSIICSELLIFW